MNKFKFKKMETEEEIQGKGYVHYKSWQQTYSDLVDKAYLNELTCEKCTEMAYQWRNNIVVAKDGDKVIGFVGYGAYRENRKIGYGEIYSIYVLEEYQKKKIGYELMNVAFDYLCDCEKVIVWVLKGNDRAIRFYKNYGFHLDGIEKEITLGTPNVELRMVYEAF